MTFETLMADGLAAMTRADFGAAAALLHQAEDAATNDADRALATMRLAGIDVLKAKSDADLRVFLENIMRRHSPVHVLIAAYYLTIAAVDRHDREAATRYVPLLLDAAREVDNPHWMIIAFDAASGAESICGNHVAAIEYSRAAVAAMADYHDDEAVRTRLSVLHNLAYNCLAASEYDDALRYAADAIAYAESTGEDALLASPLVTGAFAYLCRDRLDEAVAAVDRAAPWLGGTHLEKYMHYVRGEAARRRGDREEAARHFRQLEPFYPGIPSLTEMLLSMNLAPFLLPE